MTGPDVAIVMLVVMLTIVAFACGYYMGKDDARKERP